MKLKYNGLGVAATLVVAVLMVSFLGACSQAYYGAMEKVGIHKRDQ